MDATVVSRTEELMNFGVTFQTDPPAWRVVQLTKRAEQLGFTKDLYIGSFGRMVWPRLQRRDPLRAYGYRRRVASGISILINVAKC